MTPRTHPVEPDELDRYLIGELPIARVQALEAHIATCASCQGALEAATRRDGELRAAAAAWADRAADRGGRRRQLFAAGTVAALAAIALFTVMTSPPSPLPPYTITPSAGDQPLRGEPSSTGALVVSPGSQIQLVLEPAAEVAEARFLLFDQFDGAIRELAPTVELADGGAARITLILEAGAPEARPGSHTLITVIAPPQTPVPPEALLSPPSADTPWRAYTTPVRVVPLGTP
jgi:hypothetical protein